MFHLVEGHFFLDTGSYFHVRMSLEAARILMMKGGNLLTEQYSTADEPNPVVMTLSPTVHGAFCPAAHLEKCQVILHPTSF